MKLFTVIALASAAALFSSCKTTPHPIPEKTTEKSISTAVLDIMDDEKTGWSCFSAPTPERYPGWVYRVTPEGVIFDTGDVSEVIDTRVKQGANRDFSNTQSWDAGFTLKLLGLGANTFGVNAEAGARSSFDVRIKAVNAFHETSFDFDTIGAANRFMSELFSANAYNPDHEYRIVRKARSAKTYELEITANTDAGFGATIKLPKRDNLQVGGSVECANGDETETALKAKPETETTQNVIGEDAAKESAECAPRIFDREKKAVYKIKQTFAEPLRMCVLSEKITLVPLDCDKVECKSTDLSKDGTYYGVKLKRVGENITDASTEGLWSDE